MTQQDEMEGLELHGHLDEEVQEEPGAGGWDWTWETCRGKQRRDSMTWLRHLP